MINKICVSCASYGMSLNSKTTKVMLIRKDNKDHSINVTAEGIRLEEVGEYKCLR